MNWQTLLAIDFDKWATATYRANFPGVRVECGPVADFLDRLPSADVLLGGPPCQPFSSAGEGEGENDDRDCIPDFIAAVGRVRPRMFLMENVAGLLQAKHLHYFHRAIEQLEAGGYVVRYRLLDSVSFGVPQFRNRVWVWGIRSDLYAAGMRHQWPEPTHAWPPPAGETFWGPGLLPGVTVGHALGIGGYSQRVIGGGGNPRFPGDVRTERDITEEPSTTLGVDAGNAHPRLQAEIAEPTSLFIRRMRGKGMLERDGERRDHPITEPSPAITVSKGGGGTPLYWHAVESPRPWSWSDAMLAKQAPIALDEPSPTVVRNWSKGWPYGWPYGCLHWKQTPEGLWIRRLHPLECARLQSMPDDFAWPDDLPKTHAYRVIGNGWSSRIGQVFAEAFAAVDPEAQTVVDLFCGGGLGAVGWHGKAWQYEPTLSVIGGAA